MQHQVPILEENCFSEFLPTVAKLLGHQHRAVVNILEANDDDADAVTTQTVA